MPTSSIETREIEAHLSGVQHPEESLLFQAKLVLQPNLAEKVKWQQQTYRLLQLYNRQKLRAEISEVENILFSDDAHLSFRQKIFRLFRR
ncbi:MAG: hypothetical protein ACO1N7_01315 [Sphingobacteriaceae bacterium]